MFFRFIALATSISIAASVQSVGAQLMPKGTPANRIHIHSPLVTGNGYGFALINGEGEVVKLYAHPYKFERPNSDITKDGPETPNLIKGFRCINGSETDHQARTISYLSQSQVVSVRVPSAQQKNTDACDYFMPFGLKRNALIATAMGPTEPTFELKFAYPVASIDNVNTSKMQVEVVSFSGIPCRIAVVPLSAVTHTHVSETEPSTFTCKSLALLTLDKDDDVNAAVADLKAWCAGAPSDTLVGREISSLDSWRKKPTVTFKSDDERKLWRQNETILRMAQIEEGNRAGRSNHGLILASLPDGVWFIPWVRDMSYALVGLTRMGHVDEAREGILALFNAHPVGLWKKDARGADYQISVTRYYGDGSEEADFSGQKTENCEFDDWGLALWAVSEYWQKTHDFSLLSSKTYRGDTVYQSMRDFVVKPLLANMDKYQGGLIVAEDSSCWEEHQQNKHHYAYTTITAVPGLEGFLDMAQAMRDEASIKLMREKLPLLKGGFKKAFIKNGFVNGIVEADKQPKSEIDGAVLEAFNFGLVKDPKIFQNTMKQMERLKTASGGYRRNLGKGDYETHEFLMIDFNAARALQRFGKRADAAKILATLVSKSCQDNGLIPEMYVSAKARGYGDYIGDPTGAIPMVGFGSGAYVLTLTDRH